MSLFEAIDIAGSGLTAERVRMDVTSENLANAETTKTESGEPYKRQEVVLEESGSSSDFGSALSDALAGAETSFQDESSTGSEAPAGGVEVAGIVDDETPDQLVYDPSSPEANKKGYVEMPDIDTVTEMTDLISESRSYEADVTAMQTAKSMFTTTLELLK